MVIPRFPEFHNGCQPCQIITKLPYYFPAFPAHFSSLRGHAVLEDGKNSSEK